MAAALAVKAAVRSEMKIEMFHETGREMFRPH